MRDSQKSFAGTIGTGLPYQDFEEAVDSPDSVLDNLERFRPMVKEIKAMAETGGWKNYLQPFLEKLRDPMSMVKAIRAGGDPRIDAAKVELASGILNMVNTALRTGDSLARIDKEIAKKKAEANEAPA